MHDRWLKVHLHDMIQLDHTSPNVISLKKAPLWCKRRGENSLLWQSTTLMRKTTNLLMVGVTNNLLPRVTNFLLTRLSR